MSEALRINDAGAIMGIDVAAAGTFAAVRWGRDGAVTRLETLSGYAIGEPGGLNNRGATVGVVLSNDAQNDHGTIVGFCGPSADQRHAVEWRLPRRSR